MRKMMDTYTILALLNKQKHERLLSSSFIDQKTKNEIIEQLSYNKRIFWYVNQHPERFLFVWNFNSKYYIRSCWKIPLHEYLEVHEDD